MTEFFNLWIEVFLQASTAHVYNAWHMTLFVVLAGCIGFWLGYLKHEELENECSDLKRQLGEGPGITQDHKW